ncbi:TraB/GumN family protein [Longitalea arenae]|uniref:TraB/GumN family protein n=1 Tax=Longitalea arenae TaxID=2812558 RepID=UPI001967990E|nr:TraB/GumN family protein [Longitalea arenae]
MYPIRFAYCLLALCLVTTCTYGQHPYPKSLLWRISGKGLKQPSYLFGTIHLTDKRLFKLGDSVYRAIEKTEGLAIEVNPDEMGAYYINKAINEAEGAKLQELLSEKDFKKYSNALAKKFKKPASEITTGDIVAAKNKWMSDYLEKGEMPTFLDAYLYNIARRQGKWVGGVEDIADQAGLLDDLVDKTDIDMLLAGDSSNLKKAANNMMERMVEMYISQDLSGIESIGAGGSARVNDLLLIKRNVKMARRIDSLTTLRTMFIAVGAAHLPGDSGVIHLLQSRGFTVEPVFSSQKIDAANYTFKEVKLPWSESEDKQGFYKVSMPGNVIDVKVFGFIDMKYLFDIFTMSNYCTMSFVTPFTPTNKDSALQELAQRMFQTKEKIAGKNVSNNGIEGKEFIHNLKGEKMRIQAFVHENLVYVAFMNAVKKDMLNSEDAERFFKSFLITKKQPAKTGAFAFVDSVMGISFISPAELTFNKKLSNDRDGWHISAFSGADVSGGTYVMLFSKDILPGHFLRSDSIVQNWLIESMKPQYTRLQVDTIQLQGYKGIVLKGEHIEQKGIYMQTVSLIRNNRNIVLLAISDSANMHTPETQKIFHSLRFIPAPAKTWEIHTTRDSMFSARVPGAFRNEDSSSNGFIYSYDTTTASSYFLTPETLPKYTWFKNDSLFWENTVMRYTSNDILIKKTSIVYDGRPAAELLIKDEGGAYKRGRLLLHDDKVISLIVVGDSNFVYNADADTFFNSFRINTPQVNKDFITRSKAGLLLYDLASKDSATKTEAVAALGNTEFDEEDIPLLQEALFKRYSAFYSDDEATYTNLRLAMMLGRLNHASTISFIREKYPLLSQENEKFRNTALTTLANLLTQASYDTLASLIKQYGAPKDAFEYQFTSALEDSLALTASIFNTLQQLAKDSTHAPQIAGLTQTLADSGFIKKEALASLQSDFINAAKKLLAGVKKEKVEAYTLEALLALIGSFNTSAGNAVLRSYLTVKDLDLKKQAAIELIKNKQTVPAEVLLALAADDNTRTIFYRELKELKKTALFPAVYATQQAFGRSAIYALAAEDYEIKKISFLAKRTASFKGKPYTFYLYQVVLKDDEAAGYLGIAGGYTAGSTSLKTAIYLNGLYWDETYSATKVNTHFKAFLKSREKYHDAE